MALWFGVQWITLGCDWSAFWYSQVLWHVAHTWMPVFLSVKAPDDCSWRCNFVSTHSQSSTELSKASLTLHTCVTCVRSMGRNVSWTNKCLCYKTTNTCEWDKVGTGILSSCGLTGLWPWKIETRQCIVRRTSDRPDWHAKRTWAQQEISSLNLANISWWKNHNRSMHTDNKPPNQDQRMEGTFTQPI